MKGCPYDCGLCNNHAQHTCTALIEVTWRCNLACPVCFASKSTDGSAQPAHSEKQPTVIPEPVQGANAADPTLAEITALLHSTMQATGGCNLQLSGGEPTVRSDLPEIIRQAKAVGFPFVQLNTNGLRFASDPEYAATLAAAGLDSVFFQFDGLTQETWQTLRGRSLLQDKILALGRLAEAGIGIVLVPTVVPGVNTHELGTILQFAIEHAPAVRGVHFQPISYFGKYPSPPDDAARVTLPEIMLQLEEQTNGLVHAGDFLPPGCEHSLCSFHANYIVQESGALQRISVPKASCDCSPIVAAEGAAKSRSFVKAQWAGPEKQKNTADSCTTGTTCCSSKAHPESPPAPAKAADAFEEFILRATTHRFAISGMAFQDAWTVDLERVQGCCIHVVAPDGRLVPFCAYNLTAADGTPMHRGKQVANP